MKKILEVSVANFKREIDCSLKIVKSQTVPKELANFKEWLYQFYQDLRTKIDKFEYYLNLNDSSIEADIYLSLATDRNRFQLISSKLMPGLYRTHKNDRLPLLLLKWLHDQHEHTKDKPFVIMDGDFAILPQVGFPICYYLPIVSQQSLLFLPLFFHELGHYLYQCHAQEMDDLVIELQKRLTKHLAIPFKTNSLQSKDSINKAQVIVETWYEWIQEFFCDAVGLTIGGSSYLKAFSHYLRISGRQSFFHAENDLMNSGHPVTWLRIQFLISRAHEMGLTDEADNVEFEWRAIAQALDITEDYFGYYTTAYKDDVKEILDYMLIETSPMTYTNYLHDKEGNPNFLNLIKEAWAKFEDAPDKYVEWEQKSLNELLAK
ncbi:hypothetical protein [Pedobacter agri]|uniref:hypothetical protein n=1 Tax=Pedobacter agri TaxID=454586 RepID=UPI002930B2DD|nr:hypothetical protein [Pedobacter agri]